jgi:hypothetical protein
VALAGGGIGIGRLKGVRFIPDLDQGTKDDVAVFVAPVMQRQPVDRHIDQLPAASWAIQVQPCHHRSLESLRQLSP